MSLMRRRCWRRQMWSNVMYCACVTFLGSLHTNVRHLLLFSCWIVVCQESSVKDVQPDDSVLEGSPGGEAGLAVHRKLYHQVVFLVWLLQFQFVYQARDFEELRQILPRQAWRCRGAGIAMGNGGEWKLMPLGAYGKRKEVKDCVWRAPYPKTVLIHPTKIFCMIQLAALGKEVKGGRCLLHVTLTVDRKRIPLRTAIICSFWTLLPKRLTLGSERYLCDFLSSPVSIDRHYISFWTFEEYEWDWWVMGLNFKMILCFKFVFKIVLYPLTNKKAEECLAAVCFDERPSLELVKIQAIQEP